MIGRTIRHYTIDEKIGQGGMGEVYRATDGKLRKSVAFKFLPQATAQDETARKRLLREARAAAALDHPYICHVYEVGEVDGIDYIVMEFVSGQTLQEKLREELLPVKECLRIASEMAEALDKAQQKGIVHRDLKPANIMIPPEGHVKVMDFGLAKRVDRKEGDLEDVARQLTREGVIVGTIPYMSPEQLRGEAVDSRSDIFSFGVILYEMLTGLHPFRKSDAMATVSSILQDEPVPVGLQREGISPVVQYMVRKMLAKDPARRYQLAKDVHTDLTSALEDSAGQWIPSPGQGSATKTDSRSLSLRTMLGLVALFTGLAAAATWMLKPAAEPPLLKYSIPMQGRSAAPLAEISPDGKLLVCSTEEGLRFRKLNELHPVLMPDTEGATNAFFSPDSRFLGYGHRGGLWKASLNNTSDRVRLCDLPSTYSGATWDTAGSVVFAAAGALFRVSAQGGDPERILETERGNFAFLRPRPLPDQRGFIFSMVNPGWRHRIDAFVDGERIALLTEEQEILRNPVYSGSGHLLYVRELKNPGLWAVPFSLSSLKPTGEPFLIDRNGTSPSVSNDQTLVFLTSAGDLRELARLDRNGQRLGSIGLAMKGMHGPAISPDGNQAAVTVDFDGNPEVVIFDVRTGDHRRFTFWRDYDHESAWTASGDYLAFERHAQPSEIWIRRADFSTGERRLTVGAAPSFSPDDRLLIFRGIGETCLRYLEWQQEGEAKCFQVNEPNPGRPRLSPNGRWLVYVAEDESGRRQIFARQFPSAEGKQQLSDNGGFFPRWNPNGNELFFVGGEQASDWNPVVQYLMSVEVRNQRDGSVVFGTPRKLLRYYGSGYDVDQDGDSFIMPIPVSQSLTTMNIVHNWYSEFRDGQ